MSKTQDYIDQYAQLAMEQMERYGIPASITLAQALLESGKGESRLARQENNHFGIKATKAWLDNGGEYGIYTDDKPNEKFCSYQSVRDSFEHHSRFIVDNSRYSGCLSLPVNDYRGWAEGLQKAGYATSSRYSSSLISIIESNNLQKYDQMVISSPGRYATDYQANLPDRSNILTHRGLDRSHVADANANSVGNGIDESLQLSEGKNSQETDLSKFQIDEGEDFDTWMKRLMAGTDDDGQSQSQSSDPITGMVITMFTSLFAIAAMIDNKTPLEQSAEARRAVNDQEIDLMPILNQQNDKNVIGVINRGVENVNGTHDSNIKDSQDQSNAQTTSSSLPSGLQVEDIRSCKFRVTEQAKATIVIEDNMGRTHSYAVSSKELANLQSTLNTPQMSTQQKTMAVVAFIGSSMSKDVERGNNQQMANSNSVDKSDGNSIWTAKSAQAVTADEVSTPTVSTSQSSNPTPTITVSTAAQISSRNYEIAENQSQSREGQSYSR